MAELAIVSFVGGSLSLIVTMRNAIERLLGDIDVFKTQNGILIPLSGKLNLLSIHLKIWQTFWNIYDGTPATLLSSYWGELGSGEIRKILSYVQIQLVKVNAEFESKYGHVSNDIWPRETFSSSQRALSRVEEIESLRSLTQRFTHGRSPFQRVSTALFTGSIFHKHLESLEDTVKLLQDIAEKRFVEHVCACKPLEWEGHVEYTAARDHLTYLADRSSVASQALQDLIKDTEDHNVDFCLDHGTSPDQRQTKIFGSARECHISYNLCVSPRHQLSEKCSLRIQCREAKMSSISNIQWDQNLKHALQKLYSSEDTSNNLYVRIAENTPGFIVSGHYLPQQEFENLRTFMVSTKSDFARNLHGRFSRPERTRLAYELAECALLFLKTEWFSELCSCCIFRLESADLKTIFTVRVNRLIHSDHVDPETGQSCHLTQWCEEELLRMHIRRLGVLLAEIAIGSPIFEVAFNKLRNDIEIDFEAVGGRETEAAGASHFKDILRRVRYEGSEDLMDAVAYCLKQGNAPRHVVRADLNSFYDHVVEP